MKKPERKKLRRLVRERKSIREIGEILGRSYTSVRYWLRELNLKTDAPKGPRKTKIAPKTPCAICGNVPKKPGRLCGSCRTKIRRYRFKKAAVAHLGGECHKCGVTGGPEIFIFHHVDPKQKEYQISSRANKKWDSVKTELAKCVLMCANCHKTEHSSWDDPKFLKEVHRYPPVKFG